MAQKAGQTDETRLVEDLARGANVAEAARRSGLSRRTAHRRILEPGFRRQVAKARQEMIQGATEGLSSAAEGAVETLRRLLEADSDSVKLGAAKAILDGLLKFQEVEALTNRVQKLEEGQGAFRRRIDTLTGEEAEEFYFKLRASLKEKEPLPGGEP